MKFTKKLSLLISFIMISTMITFATGDITAPTDYVAAWDFEELNGTKVRDISPNGYDGNINGITRDNVSSYLGNYGLSGSGTQKMDIANLAGTFASKNAITYATWLNPQTCDKERTIFSISNQAGGMGLSANILPTGGILLQIRKTNTTSGNMVSTGAAAAPIIPQKTWSHCVFVFELPQTPTEKATFKIYVNGALKREYSALVGDLTTFKHFEGANINNGFRVGGHASNSYIGYSDNVKVYSRAISALEATAIYNLECKTPVEPPKAGELIIDYNFDELNQSGEIIDLSGKNLNALPSNENVHLAPGYRGHGVKFDSNALSDTQVNMNDAVIDELNNSSAITVAGWFNPSQLVNQTNNAMIFNFLIDQGKTGAQAYVDKNTKKLVIGMRSTLTDGFSSFTSTYTMDEIDVWHHYTFVIDYDNTTNNGAFMCVYKDGVKANWTNTGTRTERMFKKGVPNSPSAMLGGSGWQTFIGTIDEFKVYNKRLSEAEIQNIAQDNRVTTSESSISIGTNECLSLANILVNDFDIDFGATLNTPSPLSGIKIASTGKTTVKVNDTVITNYENQQFNIGDIVTITAQGDVWENVRKYKIIIGKKDVDTTKMIVENQYGNEISYIKDGDITVTTKVRSNLNNTTAKLAIVAYDTLENRLKNVSVDSKVANISDIVTLKAQITIPQNYENIELRCYIWYDEMTPAVIPLILLKENVTINSIVLPSIFSSNSVIQRDEPIEIWGKAVADTKVDVAFGESKTSTTADFKGDFKVTLPQQSANFTPQNLVVTNLANTVTSENILVGDVWLCGGQSNMRYSVNTLLDNENIIANANYSNIRLFDQTNSYNSEPQFDVVGGGWSECNPNSVKTFSGLGYLFGRELYLDKNVPVGLISSSYGGSRLEAWMSYEAFHSDERFVALGDTLSSSDVRKPTYLFNSMVSPIAPYAITGMIFYQGEANTYNSAIYKDLFECYAKDIRSNWNNKQFPIIYAQISAYDTPYPAEDWVGLRQAQAQANIANSQMIVTMDIGEQANVHPKNKLPVAKRMLNAAKALAYNDNVMYKSASVDISTFQNDTVTLKFKDISNGLDTSKQLNGFELSDGTNVVVGNAVFSGNDTVVVSTTELNNITEVRYLNSNFPINGVTLYSLTNSEPLPIAPFKITKH